jgi:hypothetical protein
MALSFPAGLATIINSGWVREHPFVVITLTDGTILRYSTINITVGSDVYVDRLKRINGAKIGLSKAADRVTFELFNADSAIGQAMVVPATQLNRAYCVVGTIYVNINNSSDVNVIEESDGMVFVNAATDDMVEATFYSDAYSTNTIVGDIPIRKTCPWKYKGTECGYSGGLTTCDLTFDGPNGCNAHFDNNTARAKFGGQALFLDEATVQQFQNTIASSNPTPTGTTGNGDTNYDPYYDPYYSDYGVPWYYNYKSYLY